MGLFDKVMAGAEKAKEMLASESGMPELKADWKRDRVITINGTPENLDELKAAVDVTDPGSVAAYFVYAVMCLTADYETGLSMMRYLFADLEPFGRGFTEGGKTGMAGWDKYFNERLQDDDYRWLPRAYFAGACADNGFKPTQPLTIELYYNSPNTEAANEQSLKQLGRLNVVYWVKSNAAGKEVNINLSRFDNSDRWYVTSGVTSSALFYDQRAALTAAAREKLYT